MSKRYSLALVMLLAGCCLARPADAVIMAPSQIVATVPIPSQESLITRTAEGRDLAAAGNGASVARLHAVAQGSLALLASVMQADMAALPIVAAGDGDAELDNAKTAALQRLKSVRETAADAHLAWGEAADRFARRDESITALARAVDLANQAATTMTQPHPNAEPTPLQRDTRAVLSNSLRDGLPLVAPDDVLDIIAAQAQGGLWVPERENFVIPAGVVATAAIAGSAHASVAPAGSAIELLVTSGKLYSPENRSPSPGESRLTRVPPLYRTVPPDSLPNSLRMDRIVDGFVRESSGVNKGMWRRRVRVYFASTYQTRGNRDDQPRAEALCLQLLRLTAMMHQALGLTNPYTADGVTTVWLSEVSAWWPNDDDEPGVASQLPARMPQPNMPTHMGVPLAREVESTPLLKTWRAAATLDSAPGDILFFKMTQQRSETEWFRELAHEYGHVAVPAFDRYLPPLEPFGNGRLGEALGLMWAASAPSHFGVADSATVSAAADTPIVASEMANAFHEQVTQDCLVPLALWETEGPFSALNSDHSRRGLDYLIGLSLYLERAYGAPVLGAALRPLVHSTQYEGTAGMAAVTTESLLRGIPAAVQQTFDGQAHGSWVWPGAVFARRINAETLLQRGPVTLAGGSVAGWIYIPRGSRSVTLRWRELSHGATLAAPTWKQAIADGRKGTIDGYHELTLDIAERTGWQKITLSMRGSLALWSMTFGD